MSEPYVLNMESPAVKLRWISVQCYEIVLPGGAVIVTDPFYLDKSYYDAHPEAPAGEKKVYGSEGFSPEDITGADYIILNHVHADHCNLVGMLWEKFKGRVLVPGPCALELAKTFRIPTQAIYPIFPGNTYYFDDFTLKVYPGAHDVRAFREGRFNRPEDDLKHYNMMGMPDVPNELMAMGGIYNFNFMIVTKQNFKIDFSAGRDYEEHVRHVREEAPNILFRHRIRTYTPEEYAGQLEMMGAQYILPLHQTNARASDEDLNLYFHKVNKILEEKGCPARAFNPKPYQWFQVYTGIRSVQ